MAMKDTGYHHIELRDGVPWLTDTQIKVVEIARDLVRAGWDGQEIHENYPWIPLNKIYSALAYYYDNKEAIDNDMARRDRYAEEMQSKLEDPAFVARAREMKKRMQQRA
jgi:uncharacterized protein (DUF433 family)